MQKRDDAPPYMVVLRGSTTLYHRWRRSKIFFGNAGSRKVSGTGSLYRIRAGEYRMVHEVCHESRQITILSVRHRR